MKYPGSIPFRSAPKFKWLHIRYQSRRDWETKQWLEVTLSWFQIWLPFFKALITQGAVLIWCSPFSNGMTDSAISQSPKRMFVPRPTHYPRSSHLSGSLRISFLQVSKYNPSNIVHVRSGRASLTAVGSQNTCSYPLSLVSADLYPLALLSFETTTKSLLLVLIA